MSFKGISRFLSKANLTVKPNNLVKLFSFSKMSILDEMEAKGAYKKLFFTEFLVFLCYLADQST